MDKVCISVQGLTYLLGLQIEGPTPEGEISFDFMAAMVLASNYLSDDFGQTYHASFG